MTTQFTMVKPIPRPTKDRVLEYMFILQGIFIMARGMKTSLLMGLMSLKMDNLMKAV